MPALPVPYQGLRAPTLLSRRNKAVAVQDGLIGELREQVSTVPRMRRDVLLGLATLESGLEKRATGN
jgi:hypothetical protein